MGDFLIRSRELALILIIVIFFISPFSCYADESTEKKWNILGGWGDKIFSIIRDKIGNQQEERMFILKELSESGGKLTVDEIKELQKHELEMEVKSAEEDLKLLKKMNDPETGMMSGFIKLGDKIFEKAKIERDKQIKELDNKIDEIISQSNSENFQKIKLKLLSVKWTPISHSTIDEDMTEHYEKLVEKLIHQLENNN